jgi:hypothetical protein
MNKLSINTLKVLRRLYIRLHGRRRLRLPVCEQNPDKASELIYNILMKSEPCMIARFGSTELNCVVNYLGVTSNKRNLMLFIKGVSNRWWWEPSIINQMQECAGFFPAKADKIEQFCELMIQDIPGVDVLGSWLADERFFEKEMEFALKVRLSLLDPYWSKKPWTKALEGKKVLVVHPFSESIKAQYQKRELLFNNNLLPEFELTVIKAVQSLGGGETPFSDWFEALNYMKNEIDNADYDICLIGAGAYGFPLAAHVKRTGKKALHLGGSLQLLFGIRGKRWEDENYNSDYSYASLINEHWVKPANNERPKNAEKVEGACYW